MKLTKFVLCAAILLQAPAISKPVATTSLNEAISNAQIVLVVETGAMQFDDMKEGEKRKMESNEFECRKQKYKILKVLRNNSKVKLNPNACVEVNHKSNSCIVNSIIVSKRGNKLVISRTDMDAPTTVDVYNQHEKEILFLSPSQYMPGQLEHYGWFVSPQPWKESIERECSVAHKPVKSVIQLLPDCSK